MTKSPTTQPPQASEPRSPRRSSGWGLAPLVWLFRLLLLGVGGGLAALVGIAVAQVYPSTQTEEPPLLEKVLSTSRSSIDWVTNLPDRVSGRSTPAPSPAPTTPAAPTAPAAPQSSGQSSSGQSSSGQSSVPAPPAAPLSAADRQRLEAEVRQIENELQALKNRAATLEGQVGSDSTAASLEERLRTIQQQLGPQGQPQPGTGSTSSSGFNEAPIAAPTATATTTSQGNTLMVTLPTDALFESDGKSLRPTATTLLDTIAGDLQRYPGATIRVGGHTNPQGAPAADRALSFEQAKAIESYLSSKLGDTYQWVVIGYGSSQPIALGETEPQNRRIEIVIDP